MSIWGCVVFLLVVLPAFSQDTIAAFPALAKQAEAARDAHQLPKAMDLYKRAVKLKGVAATAGARAAIEAAGGSVE